MLLDFTRVALSLAVAAGHWTQSHLQDAWPDLTQFRQHRVSVDTRKSTPPRAFVGARRGTHCHYTSAWRAWSGWERVNETKALKRFLPPSYKVKTAHDPEFVSGRHDFTVSSRSIHTRRLETQERNENERESGPSQEVGRQASAHRVGL